MIVKSNKIQSLKSLQQSIKIKKDIDLYETGFYNGIEMVLSILEDRKADYICTEGKPLEIDIKHEEQKQERTVIKGVIRNGRR